MELFKSKTQGKSGRNIRLRTLTYLLFIIFISALIWNITGNLLSGQEEIKDCNKTLTIEKDRVKEVYVLKECLEK